MKPIKTGVTQGSLIGSMFCLLYINDFSAALQKSESILNADASKQNVTGNRESLFHGYKRRKRFHKSNETSSRKTQNIEYLGVRFSRHIDQIKEKLL